MSRLFGELVPESGLCSSQPTASKGLLEWIKKNEIGHDAVIETAFGQRQVIYCDYSASARAIEPIEEYIRDEVLPLYGNTHSSVTVTSEQTTLFVHEARQEIRAMTGAGDGDSVIFTGSGTTSAVELLIHLMQPSEELVVVCSRMEHHSNLLPWRKIAKHCVFVEEGASGRIESGEVERVLLEVTSLYPSSPIVCAFTACSNLTGILTDTSAVTRMAKKFKAVVVWDFASAAPYTDINANGSVPIDAIFFSGHKFIGGISAPGVLVVKKYLIAATEPKRIGGGTVFYVDGMGEWYLKDAEYREEGGTPDAVGAIRLALAVKLKRTVGEDTIIQREHEITRKVLDRFSRLKNVVLLGPPTSRSRIPVFSFLIKCTATGLFFHHNYISALLNDLFGIQSRSGCMCAGPYAQKLLGIDQELSEAFISALQEVDGLDRMHLRRVGEYSSQEILRPGFTRISIPFFWENDQVDFLMDCLEFLSLHAADFIHLYQLNNESSEWHHHKQRTFHARKWLGHVSFLSNGLQVDPPKTDPKAEFASISTVIRVTAKRARESVDTRTKMAVPDGRSAIDPRFANLRWFVLPIEVLEGSSKQVSPFSPLSFAAVVEEALSVEGETASNETNVHFDENVEEETENVQESEVCSILDADAGVCPLDGIDTGKGRMGDLGTDESPEETKATEDWNRRVIVESKQLSFEAEKRLSWFAPPLDMYKRVTEALHGLEMIKDGDRVLVCLSGGKDSLSLLHILHFYQQRCRKNKSTNFKLGAITVDPGSTAYNPRPLIEYCRSLNIDYFYEEQDIIGAARKMKNLRSICAFCSRMKRGRLAAAAQHHGWNVLAMGQHLDDLAESFFIAAFQNGNLSTMKAQYTTRDGALRVIRPLVFVRERALRDFAESNHLPVVAENCPACFNQATERHRMKQLLAQQELVFPELFNSLRAALRPLLLVDSACTDQMRQLAIENIAKYNKGKAK